MTDTTNLALPCIEGSQAQKHVTHNDALRMLDCLVQLAVSDRDLAAPPASPAEGERFIVKAPATGLWAGREDSIAAWQDGGWEFFAPQIGWMAFVADEAAFVVWNGAAWTDFSASVSVLQNLALLGVGTTADATNPLSAKLNNALFTALTAAEGGTGDLRYKLSKESAAKTLSFLFQDNFSGRAEIGLTGDDDFHFKVSPDGSTWIDALKLTAASGAALVNSPADTSSGALIVGGRGSSDALKVVRDDTSGQAARFDGYSGSSGASTNVSFTMRAARGTFAAPSALQSGDLLLTFGARGYGATGFSAQNKARIQFKAAENWTDTAQGTSITVGVTPVGSTTLVDVLTATAARVSIAAPLNLKSYTVATLPAGSAGDRAFVTDANATTFAGVVAGGGGNGVPVYHDGTNWRIG